MIGSPGKGSQELCDRKLCAAKAARSPEMQPSQDRRAHKWSGYIMQRVFSLASRQQEYGMSKELSGDAELKIDWTKPPMALNAMGF
jgi:hypothetical protein